MFSVVEVVVEDGDEVDKLGGTGTVVGNCGCFYGLHGRHRHRRRGRR